MNRRQVFILMNAILLSLQLVQAPIGNASIPPACKAKTPIFKEVSERNLLMMKKDIYKYTNQRFTLRALVNTFYNEEGVIYFKGYWVGKGVGGVSFGTTGLLAYAISESGKFDRIVEGDIVLTKIVVQPKTDTTIPIFLVCSITRIKS